MDPNSRYIIAKSTMNERINEASRARLVKGDRFADGASHSISSGRASSRIGLSTRLRGLFGNRVSGSATA